MNLSREFIIEVKLNPDPAYRLAQKADMNPNELYKLMNGIIKVKPNDERIIRIGNLLGLKPSECFHVDSSKE